jgi:hypothetical protein
MECDWLPLWQFPWSGGTPMLSPCEEVREGGGFGNGNPLEPLEFLDMAQPMYVRFNRI